MDWSKFIKGYRQNQYLIKYDFKKVKNTKLLSEYISRTCKSNDKQWLFDMCQQYHSIPKKISYKPILGPISLNYLTSKYYPHRILILGDMHNKDRICKSPGLAVDEFIHQIIAQTYNFIDIFLEIPYYYNREEDQKYYSDNAFKNSYLTQTMKSFRVCNNRIKERCNLSRCRVHFADLRSYVTQQEFEFIYGPNILNLSLNQLYRSLYSHPNIRYQKLYKQIEAIPNKKLQAGMKKAYEVCVESDFEVLAELIQKSKRGPEVNRDIKSRGLKPYMDIYLLARILRNFKKKGNEYCQSAYNSIVYVGDQHAQFYLYVLQNLGWQIEYSSKSGNNNECLLLEEIKKPFFV